MEGTPPRRPGRMRRLAFLLLCFAAGTLTPFLLFGLLDWLFPLPRERIGDVLAVHSTLIRAADDSLVSWRVDRNQNWRLPVELAGVSPRLVAATVAVEDKRFYSHCGVDPIAMLRAAGQNLFFLRRISGASTISMQAVRLLWQRPRRLSSKLVEVFRAIQLENLVGKEGVLELYFNLAPYGGNIVGAEAAARRYFGKGAANLTLGEASLLAGIPQSPSRLDPRRRPAAALERRRQVLDRMLACGAVTADEALRAEGEELELKGNARDPGLLHFAEWAGAVRPDRRGSVATTLDPEWQVRVEDAIRREGAQWSGKGLAGPAVVVLSVEDSSVLAYVGNSLATAGPGLAVDAVRSRRQPGSLLKPFLFASLAETGSLTPATRVQDTPAFWEQYAPRNIDRDWHGEMAAGDALRQSRNIPAVRQLAQLGTASFAETLAALGLDPGRPEKLGLTMALGAGEQRLIDLTNAYAALARLGRWLPVRVLRGDSPPATDRRVWSEAAAWLALSALAQSTEARTPTLAWKTGTSWNRRDAWAVLMTPKAVVGVWVGRQSGGGAQALGAEDALPLAIAIADDLGMNRGGGWEMPEGVEFVEVCAASGEIPGWNCPETITTPANKHRPLARQCRRHLTSPDLAAAGTTPPPASPAAATDRNLRILFPPPGSCFVAGAAVDGETVYFTAEAAKGDADLYWFVDGKLIATARPGQRVPWRLERGAHVLTVSDSDTSDRSHFSVVEH